LGHAAPATLGPRAARPSRSAPTHRRRAEPAGYRDSARALAQWIASACQASGLVVEACVLGVSSWKSRSPLRAARRRLVRTVLDASGLSADQHNARWLCAGYIGSISGCGDYAANRAHDGRATREKSANAARKQQCPTSQPGRSRIQRTSLCRIELRPFSDAVNVRLDRRKHRSGRPRDRTKP
jgi:hypothetical protein